MRFIMGLLPIFTLFISLASAAVWSGTVHRENSGFWFLGKFAFDKDTSGEPTGSIEINLQATPAALDELQGLEILLYDDESTSWPAVYQQDLTCQEWREKAINWDASQNDINWQYKVYWDINTTHWYSKPLVGQVTRPRFWWVVLSSCDQNGTADVDYNVHFLNIQRKSWGQEFGTDEMGLNTIYVLFFIMYTFLAAAQVLAVVIFRRKQNYVHSLISLFTGVVLLEFLYVFSKLIHYGVYTNDGKGVMFFNDLGDVVEVFARVTFILMIMLLASGWTIVTDKLEEKWIIIVSVVLFFVASTAVLIWKLAVQDPRETDLPYEYRVLSLLLLLVWFGLAIWFVVTTFRNWRREDNPVKKKLYFRLLTIYGLWFVAIPVSYAISMATDPWVRTKVTVSTTLIFSALAYIQMIWLLWPTRAEEYFAVEKPHVPTSLNHYEHL